MVNRVVIPPKSNVLAEGKICLGLGGSYSVQIGMVVPSEKSYSVMLARSFVRCQERVPLRLMNISATYINKTILTGTVVGKLFWKPGKGQGKRLAYLVFRSVLRDWWGCSSNCVGSAQARHQKPTSYQTGSQTSTISHAKGSRRTRIWYAKKRYLWTFTEHLVISNLFGT